jgi:hypothetical protein
MAFSSSEAGSTIMTLVADRRKVPPVAVSDSGLGMTVSRPGGGFCSVAGTEVAAGEVAGAAVGLVAATGPAVVAAAVMEVGFPQAARLSAPMIKADSCHKWDREYHPYAIHFSIFRIGREFPAGREVHFNRFSAEPFVYLYLSGYNGPACSPEDL